jgi:two-component system sensor histidine kinase YesM
MNHASIDKLKDKKGVGILNACLRLKMATDDQVCFELESESGISMMVTIKIPISNIMK